jgi:Flp pilus assembly protein TadD
MMLRALLLLTLLPGLAQAEPARVRIEHRAASVRLNAQLTSAWQAYEAGDLGTAWRLYLDVTRLDARNRDALLGLASIALKQHEDALAARHFGQVLALDPLDPHALAGLAQLESSGDASSRLKLLLEQHPGNPALHSALGLHFADHALWNEAARAFAVALRFAPDNPLLHLDLAICLDRLGQHREAGASYRRALQHDAYHRHFEAEPVERRLTELAAGPTP